MSDQGYKGVLSELQTLHVRRLARSNPPVGIDGIVAEELFGSAAMAHRLSSMGSYGMDRLPDVLDMIDRWEQRRGRPGVRKHLVDLVNLVTDGGGLPASVSQSPRYQGAKVLWDGGVGRLLGYASFDDYFETIPQVPGASEHDVRFPHLVLVDGRVATEALLTKIGLRGDHLTEWRTYFAAQADQEDRSVRWLRVRATKPETVDAGMAALLPDEAPMTFLEVTFANMYHFPEIYLAVSGGTKDADDCVPLIYRWEGWPLFSRLRTSESLERHPFLVRATPERLHK